MKSQDSNARPSAKGMFVLPTVFVLITLALVFVGIIPATGDIKDTRASIGELEADLHQQRTLLPIYQSLQQRKERSLPEGISVNELQPLRIEDLTELPDVFENLASESGVELVSATPQVRSLQNGRELLRVDVRMRGEFLTFSQLLSQLNEMPFVESIESFAIDVTDLGHEVSLSVWLAIQ